MRELQRAQVFCLEAESAGDVLRQAAAILDVNDATFLGLNIEYLSDSRMSAGVEQVIPGSLRAIGVLTLEDA